MHYVYLITCKNTKQYCGYTSRAPHVRWSEHKKTAKDGKLKNSKLHNAIRKYGVHKEEVLGRFSSELEALKAEIQTIREMKLMEEGLNMSPGGEGKTFLVKLTVDGYVIEPRAKRESKFSKPKRAKKGRYSRRRRR